MHIYFSCAFKFIPILKLEDFVKYKFFSTYLKSKTCGEYSWKVYSTTFPGTSGLLAVFHSKSQSALDIDIRYDISRPNVRPENLEGSLFKVNEIFEQIREMCWGKAVMLSLPLSIFFNLESLTYVNQATRVLIDEIFKSSSNTTQPNLSLALSLRFKTVLRLL